MKRQEGYVFAATMFAVLLLALIATLLVANATSEVRQSGGDKALSATRAAAEAAQADASFYLVNAGLTDINAIFKPYAVQFANSTNNAQSTPILASGTNTTILGSLNAMSGTAITGSANGISYQAQISFTALNPDQSSFKADGQTWYVDYRINARAGVNNYVRNVSTVGQLKMRMGRSYLNQYVLLADDGGWFNGNGGYFGNGSSYDGPVHFNSDVAFARSPAFLYGVTTAASTVKMLNCTARGWDSVSTQSDDCTTPNWGGKGIQYQVPSVKMPKNAFSQQNASLGLPTTKTDGNPADPPTTAQECGALGLTGLKCPATNAVYLPNDGAKVNGGIYIKGDAKNIVLTSVSAVPLSNQQYTITDANGKIVTILVNYNLKTTTIVEPYTKAPLPILTTTTYTGVPNGQLFSTGSIQSLTGPPRVGLIPSPAPDTSVPVNVLPAVADASQLNIAAASDVVVTGDLTYQKDPRSNPDANNVLGIISGTGNIHVGTTAPNDLYLQAALLSGNTNTGFVVDGLGSVGYKGGIHLLGSVAEQADGLRAQENNGRTVSGYDDAWHFDSRFLNGGSVPPFFPSTTLFQAIASYPVQQGWREQ